MDLHDYLRILRRHWLLISALTLSGVLAGGAASVLVRPTYTAETQLFVAIQNSGSVQELQQGNTFSQARVQSYVKTVVTPVVLQPVIDALGLEMTAEALGRQVNATTEANTVLINIAVTNGSPAQAAAIAQSVASSLVEAVEALEKPKAGGSSPVSLTIVTPATAPETPSAPNTRLNLVLGLLFGLALGVGVAATRSALDRRIRGESDLRTLTNAPLLGGISFDQDAAKYPLLDQASPQGPRAEAFRQLRTNLQFANVSGQAKTVAVTSSLPGEGKSTIAANLALALSRSGQTVCLVDADLRRPMIDKYLGLERNAGLTTALIGAANVDDLLQHWGEDELYVLTSGQIPPNPSELLGSAEMKQLVMHLESVFDTVIVDAPPLLPVTDAAVLSQQVGGIVLVVSADKAKNHEVQRSIESLELVGANLLGVVLNKLPVKGPDAYSYTYYSDDESQNNRSAGADKSTPFDHEQTEATSQSVAATSLQSPDDFASIGNPSHFDRLLANETSKPPTVFASRRARSD